MRKIRIGSRGSKLAVLQAETVRSQLMMHNPDVECEMVIVTTTGDKNTSVSLEQLGGEGVFVKELEESLRQGQIDLAVHSLKDMLTTVPSGLKLAAVPERADPRDVIVSPHGDLSQIPPGARIGTGSQRRAVQLKALRSDLEICGLRGNIDTRISKAFSDEMDGIIMAAAALVRLEMQDRIADFLPVEGFVPAVGQGALGIEIRADDADTLHMVTPLNHETTWQSVAAERAFLRSLGGGCRAPIAALGTVENGVLHLSGIVSDPQGNKIIRAHTSDDVLRSEEIGQDLASRMLEMGAASLIEKGQ